MHSIGHSWQTRSQLGQAVEKSENKVDQVYLQQDSASTLESASDASVRTSEICDQENTVVLEETKNA